MLDIRLGDNGEVVLSGRLDASQAEKARSFLDTITEAKVVDLKGLEYISSMGLGVLLQAQKRLLPTGKGLVLINVSKHIYDVFHYSGFDRIFEVQRAPEP
jgi:anti-sigma B factor antagonist